MRASKASSWIAGTVFLALVILAAAWFLLVSPVHAAAQETSETAQAQDDTNAMERKRVNVLKEQFNNIESYRTDLAALREQIPAVSEHSEFQRELAEIAAARQITISSLTVNSSTEVVVSAPTPPAQDPVGSDETATPAAPSSLFSGFYQVPVNLELVGSYQNMLGFISDLQSTSSRLFLVTGLTATALQEAEASGGMPPTAAGDLSLVLNGQMYVMVDPSAPREAEVPIEPVPLPVPDPAKNPLILIP